MGRSILPAPKTMPGTAARDKIHLAEAPLPFRTLLGAMRFVGISEKKETRKIPGIFGGLRLSGEPHSAHSFGCRCCFCAEWNF